MPTRNPLAAFACWVHQREIGDYAEHNELAKDWPAMQSDPRAFLRYHILRGEEQILDCFPSVLGWYTHPERRERRMPPLREQIPVVWWEVYALFPSCVQFLTLSEGRQGNYHRAFEIEYHQAMANVVAEALVELERLVRDSRYADLLPLAHPLNGDAEALAALQEFDAALTTRSAELPQPPARAIIEGRKMAVDSPFALLGDDQIAPFSCQTESDARQLAIGLVREALSFLSLADARSIPTLGWRLDALLWFAAFVASVHDPEHTFTLKPQGGSGGAQAMYNALIGELVRAYEVLIRLLGERWTTLEAHHAAGRRPEHAYTNHIRQLQTFPAR